LAWLKNLKKHILSLYFLICKNVGWPNKLAEKKRNRTKIRVIFTWNPLTLFSTALHVTEVFL
jgi:hypothetical protein